MSTSPTTYSVDPVATQPADQAQTVAPTPSGQMPPQTVDTSLTQPGSQDTTQPTTQGTTQALQPQPGQQPQQAQSATPAQATSTAQPQKAAPHPWAQALYSTAETLGGGPRYQTTVDPNTGTVTRTPVAPSGKSLAMALALTAISGSLRGLSATGPNAVGKAAGLGLDQGQQIAQQRQQQDQQQSENAIKDAQLQQITASNNLKLSAYAQSVGKADEEANQDSIAADAQAYKDAKAAGAVVADNVSAEAAKDVKTYPLGLYDRVAVGYHPRLSEGGEVYIDPSGRVVPEGTPGSRLAYDRTYAIIDRHPVSLTDDQGKNLPWVTEAINRGKILTNSNGQIGSGVRIDSTRALAIQRDLALTDAAEGDINARRQENGLPPINLDGAIKQNSSLSDSLNAFNGQLNANGHNYTQAAQALQKTDPSAMGQIAQFYGGTDTFKKFDAQSAKTATEQGYRTNGIPNDATAQQILSAPKGAYSPDVVDAATAFRKNQVTQKGEEAGAEESAKIPGQEALQNHEHALQQSDAANSADPTKNPLAIPLVEGTLDPSQLSRRSKSYDATIAAANAYSMQKYGKPFDTAKAAGDYKFATAPATKNTLNYINSVQQSGQAVLNASSAVGNTSFPALNDKKQWLKLQTGNPQVAAYHATVTEYSDQVAKILQGGGGGTSDAKLKQAQELFDQGFSPQQMSAAIQAVNPLLENRKQSMVGNNSYLQRWYGTGQQSGQPSQPSGNQPSPKPYVPAGMIAGRDGSGRIIGYKDPTTGKVTTF